MKTIKIRFVDFYPAWNPENNFLIRTLREMYEVELSENPDYLFFSCFGDEHLNYDCIKIFYTGEDISPDFNLCDYAIGFDRLCFGDRYFRHPNFSNGHAIEQAIQNRLKGEPVWNRDRGFCSFVVSNGNANPVREQFFQMMSAYRPVASGGRFLNNVGGPVDDKIEFLSDYKFNIAFENDASDGYTSEKILQAFLANTIPIYWGDPRVEDDFNPDSFIHCRNFRSFEEAVEYVKQVDNDPILYQKIMRAPIFSDGRIPEKFTKEALERFLAHIIDQPISCAKRISAFSRKRDYLQTQKEKAMFFEQMHHRLPYRIMRKIVK